MISAPTNRTLALGLFMLRIVLREIDSAPRQAFIAGGVLDEERTSAMGLVTVVKTVGCWLVFDRRICWVGIVLGGFRCCWVLKIVA